jgi:hypothetical protein
VERPSASVCVRAKVRDPGVLASLSKERDGGQERIRTFEGVSQQIYSLPRLTAPEPTLALQRGGDLGGTPDFGKGKSEGIRLDRDEALENPPAAGFRVFRGGGFA